MIIVEGPDGSGKTTLIRQMQEVWPDLEVAPRVVTKGAQAMVDLASWVDQNLQQGFQYKIFDRHRLISEYIYGPLLRQAQQSGFDNYFQTWQWLYKFYQLSPVIIYCLPPLEVVRENVLRDHENKVVHNHIDGMYTAYVHRVIMDQLNPQVNIIVWDYTIDDLIERASRNLTTDQVLNPLRPLINYAKGRAASGL